MDVLSTASQHLGRLPGASTMVLGGSTALSTAGPALEDAIAGSHLDYVTVEEGIDACTERVLQQCVGTARENDADIVTGVGGGRAMDVATGVAARLGAATTLVTVSTVPSTDAACSSVYVRYTTEGAFAEICQRSRCPELVLVDTAEHVEAPPRFLRSGIGDVLSTRFEAEAAMAAGATSRAGGVPSYAALMRARETFERLQSHGADALAAVDDGRVTDPFGKTVEAVLYLSGIGFESGVLPPPTPITTP